MVEVRVVVVVRESVVGDGVGVEVGGGGRMVWMRVAWTVVVSWMGREGGEGATGVVVVVLEAGMGNM